MKFYGKVGFWAGDVEIATDVFQPNIVERVYSGEVTRNYRKFQNGQNQNDEFRLNNQITILSDLYAYTNWHSIRYVNWNGVNWKVTTVEVAYPRLVLELGGEWNGAIAKKPEPDSPGGSSGDS